MTEPPSSVVYWTWFLVRAAILCVVLGLLMLFIDPNYFDRPVGTGECGLPADQAPATPFASALLFEARQGPGIQIVLGARDSSLTGVRAELLAPDGTLAMDQVTDLLRVDNTARWRTLFGTAPLAGSYTLRLTQSMPGRVAVYLFQGTFTERFFVLPAMALGLIALFEVLLGWRRRFRASPPLPPPSPAPQAEDDKDRGPRGT